MKKLKIPVIFITIFLFGVLGLAKSSLAAVNLPWSTTYNCPDWNTITEPLNCDGLSPAGGWTCGTGGANLYEQITSDANFPGGGGGKGQRHWEGDGSNVNSGGLSLGFNTPQPELWIRWYMRYESGFKWEYLGYDKWLYIRTGVGYDCIPEWCWVNDAQLGAQGGGTSPRCYGCGWNTVMGGSTSDGKFHSYEIHIKMDTQSSPYNGIGELWIDGTQVINKTDTNWSNGNGTARQGWTSVMIGSNQATPSNGRCMYVDFDDIAVSTTGYIGPISAPDTIPPSVPENLTAVPVSSSQINLSWNASTDNVGVAGYRIYRNGSYIANTTNTFYQDTSLSPSTSYTYRVSAYDAAGNEGSQSSQVTATTQPSPPQPPITGLYIFQDSLPAGSSILQGDPMEVLNESPYQGTNSLKITGQGTWSNCRIINLSLSVQNINWTNSYLEFAIKSPIPSSYVAVNLWGDGSKAPEQSFSLSGSGQYEIIRINMTDFSPTQSDFGSSLTQFMIGTSWGNGSSVYLDEVRIVSPGACLHESDSDCNGCVDNLELSAFIDRWKINNLDVTIRELIEAIGLWKRGGC